MADDDDETIEQLEVSEAASPSALSNDPNSVKKLQAIDLDMADIGSLAGQAARAIEHLGPQVIKENLVDRAARAAGLSTTMTAMDAARGLTRFQERSSSVQKMIEDATGTTSFALRMLESPSERLMRESGVLNSNLLKNTTTFGAIAEMERRNASAFLRPDSLAKLGIKTSWAEKFVRQNMLMNDTISNLTAFGSFKRFGFDAGNLGMPDMGVWSKIADEARSLTGKGIVGKSFADAMRLNWPTAFPEYRRPNISEIASAPLGPLAASVFATKSLADQHRDSLMRLRSPWADIENPVQSITAFGEVRALAELVSRSPPQSRKLVLPLREELGDYRQAELEPLELTDDPVLRTLVQHDAGFSAEFATLAPAAIAVIASSLGMRISVDIAFDEEKLSVMLYRHGRQLEHKLRRFIDDTMSARFGKDWLKHRADGKWREELVKRRETDIANGRKPSPLIDYADFPDYARIIERNDNWKEVFSTVFIIKVAFSETMRRLALVRNPTAHFRIVTIEDLLIFAVEARHLNRGLDGAASDTFQ